MAITISGDTPNFSAATITTVTSTTLSDGTNSTSTTNAIQGSAKAWANFNGTTSPSIRASYNISSFTRTSSGTYTVTFTNALSDANYAPVISTSGDSTGSFTVSPYGSQINAASGALVTPTTTGFSFYTNWNGSGTQNPTYISIAVFR